jgi:hypothetical protein
MKNKIVKLRKLQLLNYVIEHGKSFHYEIMKLHSYIIIHEVVCVCVFIHALTLFVASWNDGHLVEELVWGQGGIFQH